MNYLWVDGRIRNSGSSRCRRRAGPTRTGHSSWAPCAICGSPATAWSPSGRCCPNGTGRPWSRQEFRSSTGGVKAAVAGWEHSVGSPWSKSFLPLLAGTFGVDLTVHTPPSETNPGGSDRFRPPPGGGAPLSVHLHRNGSHFDGTTEPSAARRQTDSSHAPNSSPAAPLHTQHSGPPTGPAHTPTLRPAPTPTLRPTSQYATRRPSPGPPRRPPRRQPRNPRRPRRPRRLRNLLRQRLRKKPRPRPPRRRKPRPPPPPNPPPRPPRPQPPGGYRRSPPYWAPSPGAVPVPVPPPSPPPP